jgi:peptide deformylase
MAVLPIRVLGDPVLAQKAKRVRTIDASIHRLLDDMVETMRNAPGVGLAAPQVGVSLRVVVIETPDEGLIELINPEFVKRSGERDLTEGCLSVPGYQGTLTRSRQVTVKAQDRNGKEIRLKAADTLLAQALEHEIGHVNGELYIDRLSGDDELIPVRPSIDDRDGEAEEAEATIA